jgi:hypothetical protein
LKLKFLKYDFFFKFYKDTSNKLTIEFIEVNDIENDLIIKYVSNEYWINLEQSNNNDNKLFVTNKSMKQILNYKRLVDLFNGKDQIIESTDKTRITKLEIFYDLINVILSEMKLDKKIYKYNYNYSTLFESKDLCFKYHRFILNNLEFVYENIDKILTNHDNYLKLLFIIIQNQSNCSEDFCIAFHQHKLVSFKNGIEVMLSLLNKITEQHLEALLGGLNNLCKLNLNYNEIWQDKLEIFQNLAIKYEKNLKLKLICFIIISLLAKDDEMKKISIVNTEIILSIVDQVKAVTKNLKKNCKRQKIEINKELFEIASNQNGWHLIEVNIIFFIFLSV